MFPPYCLALFLAFVVWRHIIYRTCVSGVHVCGTCVAYFDLSRFILTLFTREETALGGVVDSKLRVSIPLPSTLALRLQHCLPFVFVVS